MLAEQERNTYICIRICTSLAVQLIARQVGIVTRRDEVIRDWRRQVLQLSWPVRPRRGAGHVSEKGREGSEGIRFSRSLVPNLVLDILEKVWFGRRARQRFVDALEMGENGLGEGRYRRRSVLFLGHFLFPSWLSPTWL